MIYDIYTDASCSDVHKVSAIAYIILQGRIKIDESVSVVPGLSGANHAELEAILASLRSDKMGRLRSIIEVNIHTDSAMVHNRFYRHHGGSISAFILPLIAEADRFWEAGSFFNVKNIRRNSCQHSKAVHLLCKRALKKYLLGKGLPLDRQDGRWEKVDGWE